MVVASRSDRKKFKGPCDDKGPFPCDEEGCPKGGKVSCKDLEDDCKKRFSAVFSSPPEGLGKKRVWTQCQKTCDRCGEVDKDEL